MRQSIGYRLYLIFYPMINTIDNTYSCGRLRIVAMVVAVLSVKLLTGKQADLTWPAKTKRYSIRRRGACEG